MSYTLITTSGRKMKFYLRSAAEIYRQIHGGQIHTKELTTG